jgi:hypothetical protein
VRLGKEKKIEAAACSNIGQQISSFLMHQWFSWRGTP